MNTLPQTISARDLQRSYRSLFDTVKRTGDPLVVMTRNKPEVAIVPVSMLRIDFKPLYLKKTPQFSMSSAAGMWKDRTDLGDTNEWVRSVRKDRLARVYGEGRIPN